MTDQQFDNRCGTVAVHVVIGSVPLAIVAFVLALALRAAGIL